MNTRLPLFCAALALSGCMMSNEEIAQNYGPDSEWGQAWLACDTAETYEAAFGTPSEPGPCWGSVSAVSRSANVEVYQMTTIQNRFAVVTYTRGKLSSVTVSQ